jgi:hypothetical protein
MVSKTQLASLHQKVQQRLNIKYVSAKQLTDEAVSELQKDAIGSKIDDDDTIVERVVLIFQKRSISEQNEMKVQDSGETEVTNKPEPEWKRKARLAAEKLEAEWKGKQQQTESNNQNKESSNQPPVPEQALQVDPGTSKETTTTQTTTTSSTTTKVINAGIPVKKEGKWHSVKKEDIPEGYEKENPNSVKHVKCTCTIM